jgi:hypothetical protein
MYLPRASLVEDRAARCYRVARARRRQPRAGVVARPAIHSRWRRVRHWFQRSDVRACIRLPDRTINSTQPVEVIDSMHADSVCTMLRRARRLPARRQPARAGQTVSAVAQNASGVHGPLAGRSAGAGCSNPPRPAQSSYTQARAPVTRLRHEHQQRIGTRDAQPECNGQKQDQPVDRLPGTLPKVAPRHEVRTAQRAPGRRPPAVE